jgi:hypothetical protein
MKKLIIISGCLFAFACTNPEDNANLNTDSVGKNNPGEQVINSNPGGTDQNNRQDAGTDTSNYPTDSMHKNTPINGKDTGKKQ